MQLKVARRSASLIQGKSWAIEIENHDDGASCNISNPVPSRRQAGMAFEYIGKNNFWIPRRH